MEQNKNLQEQKKLWDQNQGKNSDSPNFGIDLKAVNKQKEEDDEEKKGQEAILALLDDNTERILDSPGQEEDEVTSLYATAKNIKLAEETSHETPVFETAQKNEDETSQIDNPTLSPRP